jgi:glycosyltransferase involved in cell wall biosynthesis
VIIQSLIDPNDHKLRTPRHSRLLYVVGQLALGGLERQLYYLLANLNHARYQPAVVVWNLNTNDKYYRDIEELKIPIYGFPAHWSPLSKLIALRALARQVAPEVIHSYTYYTNIAAWWAARGMGAIPIGSVRNDFTLDRQDAGIVLGRLCVRWPSGQIYNSFNAEREAKRSTSMMFRPRHIYVVTNGVDLDFFSPQSHPERGYILAVGNMYARKRWDRLIRAVALLASKGLCPEVVHVGAGPLREELEAMAGNLGVGHLFRFLGARHDIPDLLANAVFLVHTAENEGCPNVVMEAMACGRAVVAIDAGDVSHLIDDGKTGFVVPKEDEAALADRIATLLKNVQLCRRMGDAGRIKAEQAFGLDRLRIETFAAYQAEGWEDR